jgi:glycosyltransferase involved in cell wall biosynthesis
MSNQPLVTIITVTFNSSAFVKDAIESVLQQRVDDFEYVIIDDNSTDNTWSIIKSYQDNRILSFRNDSNLGEYENRNKAISIAKGKYIVFVDGDDFTLNRGIEIAVAEMELHPECSFGIVKSENPKYIGPLSIKPADIYKLEFFGGGILNSSLANNIFRTETLKKHYFLTGYKNSDSYTRLLLAQFSNTLISIFPISVWRITENQASKKIKIENQLLQQIRFYYEKILNNPNFDLIDKTSFKPIYYRSYFKLFFYYLQRFNLKKIIQLRKYKLDSFFTIFRFRLKKVMKNYWDEYNYKNINIQFKNKR